MSFQYSHRGWTHTGMTRNGTRSCRSNTVTGDELIPVWLVMVRDHVVPIQLLGMNSYWYESRTGTRSCRFNTVTGDELVPVWKSYRYEIMSFQYSYRDELVPVWLLLVWNFVPLSCKEKHGHNKNRVELIRVWKSYRYHVITPLVWILNLLAKHNYTLRTDVFCLCEPLCAACVCSVEIQVEI